MLPVAAGQKLGTGGGGNFFYYLFLYNDVSCNITPKTYENKLTLKRGSVDIQGMSKYLVFAGNCIFGFSTVRTIYLCKILNKNVKIKTPLFLSLIHI